MLGLVVFLSLLVVSSQGFYLPGVAPRDYDSGEPIDIKVVRLDSVKTQLPYDYYELPFCAPKEISPDGENLGEILMGDRIENSAYDVSMNVRETCKILCRKTYTAKEMKQFSTFVKNEYTVNWLVDNLPAMTKHVLPSMDDDSENEEPEVRYHKGYALGFSSELPGTKNGESKGATHYLNNHIVLTLYAHEHNPYEGGEEERLAAEKFPTTQTKEDKLLASLASGFRVVGFEVQPYSMKHVVDGQWKGAGTKLSTCTENRPVESSEFPQPVSGQLSESDYTVIWTYDVRWEQSDIKWASRWDVYLKMTDSEIHWFSIVNSMMIVLFLTGMVALILIRTLRKDLVRYNDDEEMSIELQQEEKGWKLIHGDVFRAPRHGAWLAVFVGSGAQIIGMTLATLFFAMLGFLSPANRGSLMTAFVVIFVLMGALAGYFSVLLHQRFKLPNEQWLRQSIITAVLFPGVTFAVFFLLNFLVWGQHSSGAVPFPTLVSLLVMWFGVSTPLVVLGGRIASKRVLPTPPMKVNLIARLILDERPVYSKALVHILLGGILPFGASFIEIFFILSSLWQHQYYYMFTCLFIVFGILVVTCAEIAIVLCYFQLLSEDHQWHWRSFLASGSSAFYLFLYSIVYFSTKLEITYTVSAMLYFGYMFLGCIAFFILTGTIGFTACSYFVWKIYGALKID